MTNKLSIPEGTYCVAQTPKKNNGLGKAIFGEVEELDLSIVPTTHLLAVLMHHLTVESQKPSSP